MTPNDTMVEAIALSSPSGRMSKRAREAAVKRLGDALFGEGSGFELPPPPRTVPEAVLLREKAEWFRGLAAKGMRPRVHRREAEMLEAQASRLEVAGGAR